MPITADIAREMQAKGVEVRRNNKIKRDNLFQVVQGLEAKLHVITGVIEQAGQPELTILAQINNLDRAIKLAGPGSTEQTRLIQSKATLYSLIHPKPGVARPRRTRQPQSLPLPEPAQEPRPAQVQPAQVVPGVVPGTTSTTPAQG